MTCSETSQSLNVLNWLIQKVYYSGFGTLEYFRWLEHLTSVLRAVSLRSKTSPSVCLLACLFVCLSICLFRKTCLAYQNYLTYLTRGCHSDFLNVIHQYVVNFILCFNIFLLMQLLETFFSLINNRRKSAFYISCEVSVYSVF